MDKNRELKAEYKA